MLDKARQDDNRISLIGLVEPHLHETLCYTFNKNMYGKYVNKINEFHLGLIFTHVSEEKWRLYFILFSYFESHAIFFKSEIKWFSFPNIVHQRRIILQFFCICFQAWNWWFETHKVASAYTMSKQINTGYSSRVRLL